MHFGWILSVIASAGFACAAIAEPQFVILNTDVFTADPAHPRASAVAIEDGLFAAVGDDGEVRALAGPDTRIIDAGGRLLVPGLTEAHVHLGGPPFRPLPMPGLPFPGPTPDEALALVADAVRVPGDWIGAFIGPMVARDRRDWRAALDTVAPDRPVMLLGFWGHTTILNSTALDRLGITEDVPDPIGGWWGRRPDGRLDGRAYESAEEIAWRGVPAPPDPGLLTAVFREAGERYVRWGVTAIDLMNTGRALSPTLAAIEPADTPQKWTIYSWAGPVAAIADAWKAIYEAPATLPERVRIEGPKWLLDGTGVEQNAYQRESYRDRPDWRGRSNHSDAELREILETALQAPTQLALHVVGDAETDRLLAAMEALAPPEIWQDKRVRIEHGDGLREDTLTRAAALGVVVTQNPTHLPPPRGDGGPPPLFDRPSMLASIAAAGIPLALGSDGGPDEANPFLNILLATIYAEPGEALTREQALVAYTAGGAYAGGEEASRGRIAPGLAADLAILSQDALSVPPPALPATTSLLTLVDGVIVFEDPALTAPPPD